MTIKILRGFNDERVSKTLYQWTLFEYVYKKVTIQIETNIIVVLRV